MNTALTAADGVESMPLLLRRVVETLPRFAYQFAHEASLHEGIAQVLTEAGVAFERERVAGPQDRFDFYLPPGIVIEAKVKGSFPEALRQIDRYAARDDVLAVVLVSSRMWAKGQTVMPATLRGKPARIVYLRGASF